MCFVSLWYVVARSSPRLVCLHLSELLLGVLYAQTDYVNYLCVSEPQMCQFVGESFGTGCVGRVSTIKDL